MDEKSTRIAKHGDGVSYMNDPVPRKNTKSLPIIRNDDATSKSSNCPRNPINAIPRKTKCGRNFQINDLIKAALAGTSPRNLINVIPRKTKYGRATSLNHNTKRFWCEDELPTAAKRPKESKSNINYNPQPQTKKSKSNCRDSPATYNNSANRSHAEDCDVAITSIPMYEKVKEGRITGYPIVVTQGKTEHDAILLNCHDNNPQEYLTQHKDGKVKVRWRHAGYNGHVLTSTVRLKQMNVPLPTRQAAAKSGLLLRAGGKEIVMSRAGNSNGLEEDGDVPILKAVRSAAAKSGLLLRAGGKEVVMSHAGNSDGLEEDDDVPILKAVRLDKFENGHVKDRDDDEDYNDEEDLDEPLVCYTKTNSVVYSGKGGTSLMATDSNSQAEVGIEATEDIVTEKENYVKPDTVISFCDNVYEHDTDSDEPNLQAVTKYVKTKSVRVGTDDDIDTKPSVVTSTENSVYEHDTDNDEPNQKSLSSNLGVKSKEADADEGIDMKPYDVTSTGCIVFECSTGNDEPTLQVVTSNVDVKSEADTDGENDLNPHGAASAGGNAFKYNTYDNDHFSRTQLSKGDNAGCKKCVGANTVAPVKPESSVFKAPPSQKNSYICSNCKVPKGMRAFWKHQSMKFCENVTCKKCVVMINNLDKRTCSSCEEVKINNCFEKTQLNKGIMAECLKCIAQRIPQICSNCKVLKSKQAFNRHQLTKFCENATCIECDVMMQILDKRTCSSCKEEKTNDRFKKAQLNKGTMAECLNCIGQRKASAKGERERLKEVAAAQLRVWNKMMESLEERSRAKCDAVKKALTFNGEEKKEGKSICNECIDEIIDEADAAKVEIELQQLTYNYLAL